MAKPKNKKFTLTDALIEGKAQPFKVPENWCWVRTKSVFDIVVGATPSTSHKEYYNNGTIVWLPSGCCQDCVVEKDLSNYKMITEEGYNSCSTKLMPPGTVMIALTGATAGKVGYLPFEACGNQSIVGLLPNQIIYPKFMFYQLMARRKEILNDCVGSAQPHISKEYVSNMPLALPTMAEQQRITERIESMFVKLDEAKSQLETALEDTEVRKTAILHSAFKGQLTKAWREEHRACENTVLEAVRVYSNSLSNKDKKFIAEGQTEINPIEMSGDIVWYETKIGAISRVTNGSTPSRQCEQYWNGDIPWVSSGEVRNNIIDVTEECITQEGYDSSSVKLLPKGTVLIAMIGEGKTRGQSAVLNIEATTNQNIAAIVIEHGQINSKFLWYWLQKEYKKNREKGAGSGPQALNCQRVRELDMIVPPIEEQDAIVEIIDELMQKEMQVIETINEAIDKISLIKKSILAKAFRGEFGTNNPDEESAVELLKQILAEEL